MNKIMTSETIKLKTLELDDFEDVFEWRKNLITRKMFRYTGRVDRNKFYDIFVNYLNDLSFIALYNDNKIGFIRLENMHRGTYEISINVNPKYRGKGYGKRILNKLLEKKINGVDLIFSSIKKNNIPSIKLFLSCGFQEITTSDTAEYREFNYRFA